MERFPLSSRQISPSAIRTRTASENCACSVAERAAYSSANVLMCEQDSSFPAVNIEIPRKIVRVIALSFPALYGQFIRGGLRYHPLLPFCNCALRLLYHWQGDLKMLRRASVVLSIAEARSAVLTFQSPWSAVSRARLYADVWYNATSIGHDCPGRHLY